MFRRFVKQWQKSKPLSIGRRIALTKCQPSSRLVGNPLSEVIANEGDPFPMPFRASFKPKCISDMPMLENWLQGEANRFNRWLEEDQ